MAVYDTHILYITAPGNLIKKKDGRLRIPRQLRHVHGTRTGLAGPLMKPFPIFTCRPIDFVPLF